MHLANTDLGAVDRRHLDDGVDAVVVEPERDEKNEGLAVLAQSAKRLQKAPEGSAERLHARRLAGPQPSRRLGHDAQDRNREKDPPDAYAGKCHA